LEAQTKEKQNWTEADEQFQKNIQEGIEACDHIIETLQRYEQEMIKAEKWEQLEEES
jgi:hypothetical protein